MIRTGRRTTAVTHAFCEPVTASTLSAVHIRLLGPEGIKPGGGVQTPAMCGRDLHGGWDLPDDPVTPARVTELTAHTGPGRLCQACIDTYLT